MGKAGHEPAATDAADDAERQNDLSSMGGGKRAGRPLQVPALQPVSGFATEIDAFPAELIVLQ